MTQQKKSPKDSAATPTQAQNPKNESTEDAKAPQDIKEIGGRQGPEPTRYGDWEKGGKCVDF